MAKNIAYVFTEEACDLPARRCENAIVAVTSLQKESRTLVSCLRNRCSHSAEPLDQQLVEPVGCVQRDPVAGTIYLFVAPGTFDESA
jgi:hypothetical protein